MMHRLLFSTILLALSGCASLVPYEPPDVTVVDLEITDLTLLETSGFLTVRIANENPDPLSVDGAVYNLYLDGIKVGKALSNHRLEIPRLDTVTDRSEIHINNLALATRLASLLDTQTLSYRLKGKLYTEASFGRRKLVFDRHGTLDLGNTPGAGGP